MNLLLEMKPSNLNQFSLSVLWKPIFQPPELPFAVKFVNVYNKHRGIRGYPMIAKGFILQILNWKNFSLGPTQLRYINLLSAVPLTAYDIFLHSKKEVDKKNVRKVLTRLFELGIIEIVEGAYPHNAKPYRLTTAGLFGYLLHVHFMPYVLKQYEDNILFETLLYRFMERDTLEYFHSIYRIELLNRVL